MAKSARASSLKKNNQALKANVFGPVETARAERLSARLMELAKAPKPETSDVNMDVVIEDEAQDNDKTENADATVMALDSKPSKARPGRKGIEKRRKKPSKIVFQSYKDRNGKKTRGSK